MLSLLRKSGPECICYSGHHQGKALDSKEIPPVLCIHFIKQFSICVILCIHDQAQISEAPDNGPCHIKVMDLKKKICITDSIGAHIMIQKQAVSAMFLLRCQSCDLFFDIFSGKHRDTGQCPPDLPRIPDKLPGLFVFSTIRVSSSSERLFLYIPPVFLPVLCSQQQGLSPVPGKGSRHGYYPEDIYGSDPQNIPLPELF